MAMNVHKVVIFGQEYMIKSSASSEYINKVAAYLNEKMQEVQDSGIDQSTQQLRIAILAAMNITDELLSNNDKNKLMVEKIEKKTLAISDYVDKKINSIKD
tara:strand:+ start:172 stop:474 length:303 start_codon:yes stop_codon:yes gene_type:complete